MKTKVILLAVPLFVACSFGLYSIVKTDATSVPSQPEAPKKILAYQPQKFVDTGGFEAILASLSPIKNPTSLESTRDAFTDLDRRAIAEIDKRVASNDLPVEEKPALFIRKAGLLMYGGNPVSAYDVLQEARGLVDSSDRLAEKWLYSIVYFQGVAGLRRGELENCLECRGEGACVFPIPPTAVHTKPTGSRLAIRHFTEYLEQFPGDLGVRWLLNLAYMTLG
jgi:hypothetical protein